MYTIQVCKTGPKNSPRYVFKMEPIIESIAMLKALICPNPLTIRKFKDILWLRLYEIQTNYDQ